MPTQDQIFLKKEGDRWYQRNRAVLQTPDALQQDWPLKLLKTAGLKPKRVLEVGCSTGWRLAEIQKRYRAHCIGIDPSQQALRAGRRSYPGVYFKRGLACSLPLAPGERFDLVVVNFVLHWISRQSLLTSVAEIDRAIADNGYLLLSDFLPHRPGKTPYHHLPRQKVFTYKMDYANLFTASGLYTLVRQQIFDHSRKLIHAPIPSDRRAVCTLLKRRLP